MSSNCFRCLQEDGKDIPFTKPECSVCGFVKEMNELAWRAHTMGAKVAFQLVFLTILIAALTAVLLVLLTIG